MPTAQPQQQRSQEVLYLLARHYDEWGLGRFHIFLDSPMAIEASADSDFFFEAVFPIELVADGGMIERGPAQAQTDWTAGGQMKFKAVLEFAVMKETTKPIATIPR